MSLPALIASPVSDVISKLQTRLSKQGSDGLCFWFEAVLEELLRKEMRFPLVGQSSPFLIALGNSVQMCY